MKLLKYYCVNLHEVPSILYQVYDMNDIGYGEHKIKYTFSCTHALKGCEFDIIYLLKQLFCAIKY